MTLSEEKNGHVSILGLSGRFDQEGAKVFGEKIAQILAGGGRYILLDFTEVTYISSAGLRELVMAAKQLASASGMMVLAGLTEPVRKVFQLCNMDSIFTIRTTRAESLSLFPRPAS
jgi:anti-anti-sigma factor